MTIFKALKNSASTTLSIMGVVGVVATTATAVKATPKAMALIKERSDTKGDSLTNAEIIKTTWREYALTVALGVTTAFCIVGANALNRKQQAAVLGSYALVKTAYDDYKRKVKELYGGETHRNIVDSITTEKAKDIHISHPALIGNSTLEFDVDEETRLFYDTFSERYFEATISRVLEAEIALNRNYVFGGSVTLNHFYTFLGLDGVAGGDIVGWDYEIHGIDWIDFDHSKVQLDDGYERPLECLVIDMVFSPEVLK